MIHLLSNFLSKAKYIAELYIDEPFTIKSRAKHIVDCNVTYIDYKYGTRSKYVSLNNHKNISIIQLRARKWIYFWHNVLELSFTASIELFTLSCAATYLLPVLNYVIKNDVLKKTKNSQKAIRTSLLYTK